jgi:subtilisin family serine protease
MSFGWPSCDFDGYDMLELAIDRAYSKKVLMFAAAANSGGRCGRAYPASSSQVICVHSTDTNGDRSGFSPTAESNTLNIATLGESVQSAWPTLLCREGQLVQLRSGTSYATPIIVGISAFLLHFARQHLSARESVMLKRQERMEALLKRCAERGPNYQPRDGYLYVELSLNRHNLFGQDLEGVCRDIRKTLNI